MKNPFRFLAAWSAVVLVMLLSACGGGGGDNSSSTPTNGPVSVTVTPGPNVATLVVDQGTDGTAVNSPFVTVTVCMPGTATCQSIDHVLVDTGSYGLRLAASALNLSLPVVTAPDGNPLGECAQFVSGFAWGSVRKADVEVSGEGASGVPVQVVNDTAAPYANVPAACTSAGGGVNMGVGSGAKGILGLGFLQTDCAGCVSSTAPNVYFSCVAGVCISTLTPLASQVTNPATLFATDNNGVAVVLPDVPLGGVPGATGMLIFGVGTQSNNQLGSAQVFTANASGYFTTVYKGRTLTKSFLDTGSNGIFVPDSTIASCSVGFYCPNTTLSLTATDTGANGATRTISFPVEDPRQLPASIAAAHLAGDIGGLPSVDWGLPFFFGRTVFVAFQGASTPFGTGPYWAF